MHAPALTAAAVLALAASSAAHSHNAIRRPALPRRLDADNSHSVSDPVAERGLLDALFGRYRGTGTWYGVGVSMGACGAWTSPDQRAVALNIGLYGNEDAQSGWCGKKLRITANGKTSIATVVDCCPTCPGNGDLDMSKTLFQDFAGLGDGIVDISWSWVGAGGGGDDNDNDHKGHGSSKHNDDNEDDDGEEDKPKPKPKPSKTTHTPKPTSTSHSTKSKTSTSTSTKSKTKSKKPKTTPTEAPVDNLSNLNEVIAGFQNMAQAGSN